MKTPSPSTLRQNTGIAWGACRELFFIGSARLLIFFPEIGHGRLGG